MTRVACGLGLACVCAATAFAVLVKCPDCDRQVSDHALMCPNCGCAGDYIRELLKTNVTETAEPPAFFRSLVVVTSDKAAGVGVCVRDATGSYVVTSQDLLAGAESLSLALAVGGEPLPYTSIELADDRNLARLPIAGTNAQPLATGCGLRRAQSPRSRTSRSRSHPAARRISAASCAYPDSTSAMMLIAVSHTGERQG